MTGEDTSDFRLPHPLRWIPADFALAPPVAIGPLPRAGAGAFVWKVIGHAGASAAALEYEHWLIGELARQGPPFALAVPVRTRDGATFCRLPGGGSGC